ncbi:hypothetical protein IMZ38_07265 [Thermosphaera chiliense]|uniref:Uncharacterized protein n=1 Tax=Thermosphaera chiliense TaxID=3402707 RepID=A0A7M1UQ43_9CREN|nr:hypothetical protein [Thermosphaera aggregans]QOR94388.1 hypothetical protein IMZ38_07265 [Thermosphaera aggregans]
MNPLLEDLMTGWKVVYTHYAGVAAKLASLVVEASDKPVGLVDEKNIILPYIPLEDVESGKVLTGPVQGAGRIIIVEPDRIPFLGGLVENVIVFTTPGSGLRVPRVFEKAYISKAGDEYVYLNKKSFLKIRFKILGDRLVVIEKPFGILGEGLEALKNAMLTYGELSVKDAVFILTKQLGVGKNEARRILSQLVLRKYVKIVKGKVNLY